jgi:hypothetical protein
MDDLSASKTQTPQLQGLVLIHDNSEQSSEPSDLQGELEDILDGMIQDSRAHSRAHTPLSNIPGEIPDSQASSSATEANFTSDDEIKERPGLFKDRAEEPKRDRWKSEPEQAKEDDECSFQMSLPEIDVSNIGPDFSQPEGKGKIVEASTDYESQDQFDPSSSKDHETDQPTTSSRTWIPSSKGSPPGSTTEEPFTTADELPEQMAAGETVRDTILAKAKVLLDVANLLTHFTYREVKEIKSKSLKLRNGVPSLLRKAETAQELPWGPHSHEEEHSQPPPSGRSEDTVSSLGWDDIISRFQLRETSVGTSNETPPTRHTSAGTTQEDCEPQAGIHEAGTPRQDSSMQKRKWPQQLWEMNAWKINRREN